MPTILVVDDTEEIRRLLRFSLKAAGFDAVEASNGPQALFMIETLRPDAMVLDIMMPQMTGYEVLREVKSRFPDMDLPVILLTAKTDISDKMEGFEAGAQDYLTKPFAPQELVMRVKAMLRLRQEREGLRNTAEGLAELSATDELTGLHNRRHLLQRISQCLSEYMRYNHPTALLLFDIDHFKSVNDTYGHTAGDDLLRQLSALLRTRVRQEDVLARYGGEEFIALLPSTPIRAASEMAERMLELVSSHRFECDGNSIHITISIGVAGVPGDEVTSAEELISIADKRLYVAKRTGRNRMVSREDSSANAA